MSVCLILMVSLFAIVWWVIIILSDIGNNLMLPVTAAVLGAVKNFFKDKKIYQKSGHFQDVLPLQPKAVYTYEVALWSSSLIKVNKYVNKADFSNAFINCSRQNHKSTKVFMHSHHSCSCETYSVNGSHGQGRHSLRLR